LLLPSTEEKKTALLRGGNGNFRRKGAVAGLSRSEPSGILTNITKRGSKAQKLCKRRGQKKRRDGITPSGLLEDDVTKSYPKLAAGTASSICKNSGNGACLGYRERD